MPWNPLDMYQIGRVLYGYKNNGASELSGLIYFKIIGKEKNKLTLQRMLSKASGMYCRVPSDKLKNEPPQVVTVNKNSGIVKIKYDKVTFQLKRWDGEPKYYGL